jgi:hypothetical protein
LFSVSVVLFVEVDIQLAHRVSDILFSSCSPLACASDYEGQTDLRLVDELKDIG